MPIVKKESNTMTQELNSSISKAARDTAELGTIGGIKKDIIKKWWMGVKALDRAIYTYHSSGSDKAKTIQTRLNVADKVKVEQIMSYIDANYAAWNAKKLGNKTTLIIPDSIMTWWTTMPKEGQDKFLRSTANGLTMVYEKFKIEDPDQIISITAEIYASFEKWTNIKGKSVPTVDEIKKWWIRLDDASTKRYDSGVTQERVDIISLRFGVTEQKIVQEIMSVITKNKHIWDKEKASSSVIDQKKPAGNKDEKADEFGRVSLFSEDVSRQSKK